MTSQLAAAFWLALQRDRHGPRGQRYFRAFRYLVARGFRYPTAKLPWKK